MNENPLPRLRERSTSRGSLADVIAGESDSGEGRGRGGWVGLRGWLGAVVKGWYR